MSAARPVVIFLHIPKTGGMALTKVIQRSFPADRIYDVAQKRVSRIENDLRQLAETDAARLRVVIGHQPFGLHTAVPGPAVYTTILRDPVKRLLSLYHYAREQPGHFQHDTLTRGGMTLLDLARDTANRQTRMIAGRREGAPDAADLAQAKQHLEAHFPVVGLIERFEESVALMQGHLGWPLRPLTNENVTGRRSQREALSSDEERELRAINALDYELYEFAAARLAQQIDSQPPPFRRSLARFRALNRIAAMALPLLNRWRSPIAS